MTNATHTLFSLGPHRDVFSAMEDVQRTASLYKMRAEDDGHLNEREAVWLAERVLNVLATLKDATVTCGIVSDGASVTPMMTERDAIVAALDA